MALNLSPSQVGLNAKEDGSFRMPFREQIAFFHQKLNLPTKHYDDIIKSAHDQAFVVAGAAKADLLNDLRTAVDRSIADGKSIGWFKSQFADLVKRNGWEGWTGSETKAGRDWRTRIIYQTNVMSSYSAGRYEQLMNPELLKIAPYWKYIHDDRVAHPRPLHQAWNGTVLKYDDPWWKSHFCPNGYGCRCRITSVKADEFNGEPAPDDGTYEYTDRNGVVHTLPNGVDYGWDYAPGASKVEKLTNLAEEKAMSLPLPLAISLFDEIAPVIEYSIIESGVEIDLVNATIKELMATEPSDKLLAAVKAKYPKLSTGFILELIKTQVESND